MNPIKLFTKWMQKRAHIRYLNRSLASVRNSIKRLRDDIPLSPKGQAMNDEILHFLLRQEIKLVNDIYRASME